MLGDLSTINDVIANFQVPVTLLRRAGGGAVIDGFFEPAAQVVSTVQVGTHPARGDVAELLPDQVRVRATRWFYSRDELRTFSEPAGTSSDSDVVMYQGRLFEIFRAEPFIEGGFWRCLGVQLPRQGAVSRVFFGAAAPPGSINAAWVQTLPGLYYATQREIFAQTSVGAGQNFYYAAPDAFDVPSFEGVPMATAALNVLIDGKTYTVFRSQAQALGDVVVRVS